VYLVALIFLCYPYLLSRYENTKELLLKFGWSSEDIKTGIDYATIDVYKNVVYLHIPNKITKRGETGASQVC
jgi:hypothetical protein